MANTGSRLANPPMNSTRRRRLVGPVLAAVGILTTLALVVAGFTVARVWFAVGDINRSDTLLPSTTAPRPDEQAAAPGSFNYVLMGSDSRGSGDRGRSDVLMLAHVPPTHDRVYLISFPRDMWVNIPGHGMNKINAAYAFGGEALAAQTLETIVGVRMDHAVKIDFEGFIGLTEALGGVTVDNRVASVGSGDDGVRYEWPQGEITLSGPEALAYVRQRYELPGGDLDRDERQRAVVKAIIKAMMSRDLLASPTRFNDMMGQVGRYVTVDSGLTNEVLFATAAQMRLRSTSDIELLQAPIKGFATSSTGGAIDLVNESQTAEMARAIQDGTMADYATRYRDQPYVP